MYTPLLLQLGEVFVMELLEAILYYSFYGWTISTTLFTAWIILRFIDFYIFEFPRKKPPQL